MADLTPQQHLRRVRDLETGSANFRTLWEELQQYVTPWRDPVRSARAAGMRTTDRIFDSTAPHVATLATAAVHGMTMPAGTKWFLAQHPDHELNRDVMMGRWLEEASDVLRQAFDASNLANESQELMMDLLVFGTGCLYMEAKEATAAKPFPGFRFRAMPPGSYVMAENADGIVDTLYRKFRLSADAIFRRWGDKSGESVLKDIAEGKWDRRYLIIHGVVPRNPEDVTLGNSLAIPKPQRAFQEIWITAGKGEAGPGTVGFPVVGGATTSGGGEEEIGDKDTHVLEEDGRHEFPFLVPRWRKMSGEHYGRSPGIDALPDIRTLNRAVELRLKAWALAVGPPLATSDRGVLGDVRLVPFGRTHTRGNPNDAIMPINIGANFDVANFQEEQIRDQIRRAFFVDQLQRAESQGLSPKSATEVSISFELMTRILGPVASRLIDELLSPLVKNGFRMMARLGGLDPIPDAALAENGEILVRYQGPLPRSQSIAEIDAITRWLQASLPIAEVRPEVLTPVEFTRLGRVMANAVSVPKEVMKTEEEERAEQQALAQQRQTEAEQADLLTGAEVINKVAPAVTATPQAGGF